MPSYVFKCISCDAEYEEVCSYDDSGKYKNVKCPFCDSVKKEKLLTAPLAFIFSQPEGTKNWISDSCGHDYRFKHKQPKVREERAMAQAMSKMGSNPYGNAIDDVSGGEYFGEVK